MVLWRVKYGGRRVEQKALVISSIVIGDGLPLDHAVLCTWSLAPSSWFLVFFTEYDQPESA